MLEDPYDDEPRRLLGVKLVPAWIVRLAVIVTAVLGLVFLTAE